MPACLLIGACIEVWEPHAAVRPEVLPVSPWRNYTRTRHAWLDSCDVPNRERVALVPLQGAPWSFDFLMAGGRGEYVVKRLARGGVGADDLPALREQALELMRLVTTLP